MFRRLFSRFRRRRRGSGVEIAPDEIFLDSHNLPQFDRHQMEGRLERPIPKRVMYLVAFAFCIVIVLFAGRLAHLQVVRGDTLANQSAENRLTRTPLFADRGVVLDRTGDQLVWNAPNPRTNDYSLRRYATTTGLAHLLGYVKYPSKDNAGVYYRTDFLGEAGVEEAFDERLAGTNGIKITERNALGETVSEGTIASPQDGENVRLTIDADVQHKLFEFIKKTADEHGYSGGAGVIMDVKSGELLALTSYPEYSSQVMTRGNQGKIAQLQRDKNKPFLNRAVQGLYTPGSIVKPYVAAAALEEEVIRPDTNIRSTGEITVPNPYDPDKEAVFTDWKAHGLVDMRDALAVSSNVYFYVVGGGYKDIDGLGIKRIARYMHEFGFGEPVKTVFGNDNEGVVPTPSWKEETFEDGTWRIGDTYHTAIGQYGFQVTPLQAVRAVSSIANDGKLLRPLVQRNYVDERVHATTVPVAREHLQIVREGMRQAVTSGTAGGLDVSYLDVAAKTGTAEVGSRKRRVNSWVTGFFPYDEPQYAFTVVMERGPRKNTIGGVYVMRRLLDWMHLEYPRYLK